MSTFTFSVITADGTITVTGTSADVDRGELTIWDTNLSETVPVAAFAAGRWDYYQAKASEDDSPLLRDAAPEGGAA